MTTTSQRRRRDNNDYKANYAFTPTSSYASYVILLCFGVILGVILGILVHLCYTVYTHTAPSRMLVRMARFHPIRMIKH